MNQHVSPPSETTNTEAYARHQKHRARIAYVLIWTSCTIAMFIAVAFMLFQTRVDATNLYFYLPVVAFAVIMAIAIPLTAKITKYYSN